MRPIKFKAQKQCNGQWVAGDFARSLDGKLHILGFVEEEGRMGFTGAYQIIPDTIGQFTGFTDKNGKEIYEGDVLRSDEYPYSGLKDGERDAYHAIVYYWPDVARFMTVAAKNPASDARGVSDGILDDVEREKMKTFEVIGNIHDPEWKQYRKYFQTEEEREAASWLTPKN